MSKCSKPLLYESLTTVIKFTEPNLRIHLARHLPSIKTVYKSIPLNIASLVFEKDKTIVNGTPYQIEVIGRHQKNPQIKGADQFGDLQLTPKRYHDWIEDMDNELHGCQATIQDANGTQTYRSSCTFSQGLRYLNTVILGGNNHPIRVNEFHVAEGVETIRLPIGIKFNIHKITVEIMHIGKFGPILDTFPERVELINCTVFTGSPEEVLTGPIVKNAKRIIIKEAASHSWKINIRRLSNLEVDLKYSKTDFTQFEDLVQHCVADGRPVGTTYWIGFAYMDEAILFLNEIKLRMSVRSSTRR
ncbi:hypothetical protein B9Z55_012629 [Caenorhabditis nigoni]|uniref:Uncharacterized protein n=1 Tax=Caenorhabditis nigoni TaxID=1611254 RepID=A0A2G5TY57_9PELO|nr:hypothetical protein B9Z55_012629 [Caenorhabditis nigoni]